MRRQPRSGKRHVLRWVAVGAVVIVAAGTLGAYLKYRAVYDSITRVTVPSTALGHRPPVYSTDSENILVYGDDNRAGLTPHQQYVLRTGHDQSNNTDTIMLVHISPGRHRLTVISIPRDTMVPVYECDSGPGYTGQQANPAGAVQVNSLLQIGGPTCLWKTVEQMTGIRIDHFIGIGMLGFVKVVNDLGGVNVCVPFTVKDPVSGLNLKTGEQHISGIQALAFWRTRENLGDGSDLQRIQRDQFMSAQVVKGVLRQRAAVQPDQAAEARQRRGRLDDHGRRHDGVGPGPDRGELPQPGRPERAVHHDAARAVDAERQPGPAHAAAGRRGVRGHRQGHDRAQGLDDPGGFRHRRRPGPHHQPGQRQGQGAERLRGHARRQRGGHRADQPRLQRDRDRRRPELRLHQVGRRVLHGGRPARGEHAHEGAHQRHLAAGAQPDPGHGRPDPRLRLHRAGAAGPAEPASHRHAQHRRIVGIRGREPVRLGVLVRRGRPGPVQQRDHRRRGVHRRQLGLLRAAQSFIDGPAFSGPDFTGAWAE